MSYTKILSSTEPSASKMISPYPGLRSFQERECRLFYGREDEIVDVLTLLEDKQLVVVHGASGCGKSSVVRAGVLPVFRRDALANKKSAEVVIIRPSDARGPMLSFAEELDQCVPLRSEDRRYSDWSELLISSPDLTTDAERAIGFHEIALCLVVDQFEELFQVAANGREAEAARLIEFLTGLQTPAPKGTGLGDRALSVIVTMRSDYLGQCSRWEGLAEAVNRAQYLLPRISTFGLLRAIHRPAQAEGTTVDEEVANRLLPTITAELDGLPIIQHALMQAWVAARARTGPDATVPDRVSSADLDQIGGPNNALSTHASLVLTSATDGIDGAPEAAEWIFRALSEVDADGKIIRRACTLGELISVSDSSADTVKHIIDTFRSDANGLLGPPSDMPLSQGTLIDVNHEALLRNWPYISDPSYDDKGEPHGLAYLELQDGMIWRSLVVQGEEFEDRRGGVLGPATTEQRLPWYSRIERRPEWARRHQVRAGARVVRRREWQVVANLMQASARNLQLERDKLAAEQALVQKLRRSRLEVLFLSGVLFIFVIAGGWMTYQYAQQEVIRAKSTLYASQLVLANELARRDCVGQFSDKSLIDKCITIESKTSIVALVNKTQDLVSPKTPAELPRSPYAGGLRP